MNGSSWLLKNAHLQGYASDLVAHVTYQNPQSTWRVRGTRPTKLDPRDALQLNLIEQPPKIDVFQQPTDESRLLKKVS